MDLGWRGAGGTFNKRTGESFLVTLLLFCGFWKAHTQADDGKSVYFWETGTSNPLITAKFEPFIYMHTASEGW